MDFIAPKPTQDYKVLIKCMTYNQEKYIEDALKGFVRQKTNFPFCALVVDDCSTDGNAEIIKRYEREYPDIIKGIYLPVNMYGNPEKQKYIQPWEERAQYIAYCEGDDYWLDDNKLQMQVDFLEKNKEYGMVYTNYFERIGDNLKNGTFPPIEGDCLKDYLLKKGFIPTATTLIRTRIFLQRDLEYTKMKFLMGDVPLWIQIMHVSKIKRLPYQTAVYRILTESASHSHEYEKRQCFNISAWEVRKYFADKYGLSDVSQQIEKEINKNKALLSFYKGEYWDYLRIQPWKYDVFNLKTLCWALKQKNRK